MLRYKKKEAREWGFKFLCIFAATDNALISISMLSRIYRFYRDGFRQMTWGRTLWIIILVKLFIMFFVLRLIFFKPVLAGQTTEQKQETVGLNLTR